MSFRSENNSSTSKTGIIIGLVCGFIVFFVSMAIFVYQKSGKRVPDTEAGQLERRRANRTWVAENRRASENILERRERQAREAREAREQRMNPPMYQQPAPTYQHPTPETRREWIISHQQTPAPAYGSDSPPAYDSTAVWPSRSTRT